MKDMMNISKHVFMLASARSFFELPCNYLPLALWWFCVAVLSRVVLRARSGSWG